MRKTRCKALRRAAEEHSEKNGYHPTVLPMLYKTAKRVWQHKRKG